MSNYAGPIMPTSSIYVNKVWQNGTVPKTLPAVDISAPVCCSPVAAGLVGDKDALEIALRFKALADPVRVKLVSLLFSSDVGELCSCDLATAVELVNQPSVTICRSCDVRGLSSRNAGA